MQPVRRIFIKINEDGWRSLFPAAFYKINNWKDRLYRNLVLRNRLITRMFPFRKPAILLLSYPRSGSTWVGEILSSSKQIAFLFEPVTGIYQLNFQGPALANLNDPTIFLIYQKYSQDAFSGIPPQESIARENLRGFRLMGRTTRRLLIKEVNPKATELFCQKNRPDTVFLIRHPAAVALSFWQLGWLDSADVQLDAKGYSGDAWKKFGYSYGIVMKTALEAIQRFDIHNKIVPYEKLAMDPRNEFLKVFEDLRVEVPENYDDIIDEYCFSGESTRGYETRRISSMMVTKWKNELPPDAIAKLQKGYLDSGFEYYRSNTDWKLSN